jgi:hypothetical protein
MRSILAKTTLEACDEELEVENRSSMLWWRDYRGNTLCMAFGTLRLLWIDLLYSAQFSLQITCDNCLSMNFLVYLHG